MPQFLVDPRDVSAGSREAVLRGPESHHLTQVFRARAGEPVDLFDGQGRRWRGRFVGLQEGLARIGELEPLPSNEAPVEAVLVQALLKGERWDWLISKATELGAAAVLPVRGERSVAFLKGDRAASKIARWSAVALAAAKQCERAAPPALGEPRDLSELLRDLGKPAPYELRLVFAERTAGEAPPRRGGVRRVCLAIGPEGGWNGQELEAFRQAGFRQMNLGPRILRAETAAIAALVLAQALWGDLVTLARP